jgi:membrane-associated protein
VELIAGLADIVLRLDVHLGALVRDHGAWVHVILFVVIFAETGLVVTPFLPGDSLLFVAGAIAALGGLDATVLVAALSISAILGNTTNYTIGRWLGRRFLDGGGPRWVKPEYLERTRVFYERHGGAAVLISRFLPIIRTYIPFVAGLARMGYARFTAYTVGGALLWVGSLTGAGYFFGNLPWVKANLSFIIVAIVVVSMVPVGVAAVRTRTQARP